MPCPNLGGTADLATVFKLNPTGHETVLYRLTRLNGARAFPEAGLITDRRGTFTELAPAASRVAASQLVVVSNSGEGFRFDAVGSGGVSGTESPWVSRGRSTHRFVGPRRYKCRRGRGARLLR